MTRIELGSRSKAPATLIDEEESDHNGDRDILRTPAIRQY